MNTTSLQIETWPIERITLYIRNPRRNDDAIDRMCAAIQQFGFRIPCLVRGDGELIDGHLRIKSARKLGMTEVPVILCDDWTPAQVKAFRLLVNRSATWAAWDNELLKLEMEELQQLEVNLEVTGFDMEEIDELLAVPFSDEEALAPPPLPETAISRPGDLWQLGKHRVLCGDATNADAVARLLSGARPAVMITDPPYGVELDSEWRDRAGLNGYGQAEPSYLRRTEGHQNTSISSDTRADWSEAFELAPSLEVAYVWHASKFTREVLDGLLRIGFEHHQQIIWNKGRAVLTRTHYWFQHEPCWYVRKKNAPWYGRPGENSTVWDSPSPKFLMGGSSEDKFDHPTQKPIALMQKPMENHTRRGDIVYDPFLGSGTTLMAAEVTGRVCHGLELDPKFVDVIVGRWETATNEQAVLEMDGLTFEEAGRRRT